MSSKKLYPNEKYTKIEHPDASHKEQIVKLIEYADSKKGIPIYLLYNFSDTEFDTKSYKKEEFGCTIIKAEFLKDKFFNKMKNKMNIMSFIEIHPPAFPLVDILDFTYFLSNLEINLEDENIQFKSKSQLDNDGLWVEINPSKENEKQMRGNSDKIRSFMEKIYDAYDNTFRPKYRIVITKDEIRERNINYEKRE